MRQGRQGSWERGSCVARAQRPQPLPSHLAFPRAIPSPAAPRAPSWKRRRAAASTLLGCRHPPSRIISSSRRFMPASVLSSGPRPQGSSGVEGGRRERGGLFYCIHFLSDGRCIQRTASLLPHPLEWCSAARLTPGRRLHLLRNLLLLGRGRRVAAKEVGRRRACTEKGMGSMCVGRCACMRGAGLQNQGVES